jgi:hypothetical protein
MRQTPKSEYSEVEYGLIAPNGNLYETEYEGHSGLAEDLFDFGIVTGPYGNGFYGCVHVAESDFDCARSGRYEGHRQVTQAQFNTMVEYMTAQDLLFPFHLLEVVDAKPTRKPTTFKVNPFSQVSAAS